MAAPYEIRLIGDPVLRQRATEITDVDGKLAQLAEDMLTTMYEAPGLGLAAPQVGVQKRLFVYDVGDGPQVVVNPVIQEARGEWGYDEGCLSIPGMSFELIRPKEVHLVGYDLDGVLRLERLDKGQRKQAMRTLRNRTLGLTTESARSEVPGRAGRA